MPLRTAAGVPRGATGDERLRGGGPGAPWVVPQVLEQRVSEGAAQEARMSATPTAAGSAARQSRLTALNALALRIAVEGSEPGRESGP